MVALPLAWAGTFAVWLAVILPTLSAAPAYGQSHGNWYPFTLNPGRAAPAQPAAFGKAAPLSSADQIQVQGAHFYRVGPDHQPGTADDQRVRFFGVNLSFDAAVPNRERAQALAATLASLGVNAVRLHHLDTRQVPAHAPPRGVLATGPYPTWHPEGIQRLRHFIQALAAVGIYTNLNLRVGYRFQPDVDAIPDYDATRMQRPHATPIAVYHPELVARQRHYAQALITALGLANNPALAMVEISNEASLLASWYRNEWQDAIPAAYAPELEARWNTWLRQRYGNLQQACQAWGDCRQTPTTAYLLTPTDVMTPVSTVADWWRRATDHGTAWLNATFKQSLPASEPVAASPRAQDFLRFLASEDARYFAQLKTTIQAAAGFAVPVTGTQMGYGGPLNHLAMTDMDYLDDHFYIDHPHFPEGHAGQDNWRVWNLSLRNPEKGLLLRHALRREWGKPFVVSEYNQPYPSQAGGEILPLFVALAALQDWDGLFFFEYANGAAPDSAPANFALEGDWGKWVQLAQAARLFRHAPPAPLHSNRTLTLSETDLIDLSHKSDLQAPANLAYNRLQLEPHDVWRYSVGSQVAGSKAVPTPLLPANRTEARPSPTVTLHQNHWSLQGAGHQAYAGGPALPAPQHTLHTPLSYSTTATNSLPATLWLTAIPDARLPTWQLTLGSATVGSQPGALPNRPKGYVPHPLGENSWTLEPDPASPGATSAPRHAAAPAWLPLLPMQVHWQAPIPGQRLRVYPLDTNGQRRAALPETRIQRLANGYSVLLHATPEEASPWFAWVLEPEQP